jgi:DNA repair photolyase
MGMTRVDVRLKPCNSAISPSRLPGLTWAINPYRGCAHSCAYCYAQDVTRFEPSRCWGEVVEVKIGIVQQLKRELEKGHATGVYGIGTVTDPYQPLEKEYELTRGCLAILKRHGARVSILTKSDLVLRDLDILRSWAGAEVGISIGCVDRDLARLLEPGAAAPEKRLTALRRLSEEGVPTFLMAAPIISGLSDSNQSVAELVRLAGECGVRRIIWDKYNPKPMASRRMAKVLSSAGLEMRALHTPADVARIRKVLMEECGSSKIVLEDAF